MLLKICSIISAIFSSSKNISCPTNISSINGELTIDMVHEGKLIGNINGGYERLNIAIDDTVLQQVDNIGKHYEIIRGFVIH